MIGRCDSEESERGERGEAQPSTCWGVILNRKSHICFAGCLLVSPTVCVRSTSRCASFPGAKTPKTGNSGQTTRAPLPCSGAHSCAFQVGLGKSEQVRRLRRMVLLPTPPISGAGPTIKGALKGSRLGRDWTFGILYCRLDLPISCGQNLVSPMGAPGCWPTSNLLGSWGARRRDCDASPG